jgi:protein SCO1
MKPFGGIIVALVVATACSRGPEPKQYELKGQVLGVKQDAREVLIKHEDIQGFMPGMTMPFTVRDVKLLDGLAPGDLVTATLVVAERDAHLSTLKKTGHAELEMAAPPDTASSGFELLKTGDTVPDQLLVDQNGKPRPLSTLRGHRIALTFIYTRCPMPAFCPLMDRNFQAVQREIKKTPALSDVRLVSVSFDPQFDTPPVLKAHAERLQADPLLWTFVTGEREEITRFAARFGVSVERAEQNPIDITHNLRTAIIDAEGRLVKMHSGNSWAPADIVADLKATPAPAN